VGWSAFPGGCFSGKRDHGMVKTPRAGVSFPAGPDFLPGKQGGPGLPRFAGSEIAQHFVVSGAAATGGLGRIGTGCAVALGTGKGPQRAVAEGGPVVLGGTALCQNGSTLPVPSQVQNDWANAGLDTAVSTATMV
jgi:hypothetical protein